MIEKIIICSLIVTAVYSVMKEGMILDFIGDWLYKKLPEMFHKPVFDCLTCMGGLWGMVVYWGVFHESIAEWVVVNISVIGLNAIIAKFLSLDDDI